MYVLRPQLMGGLVGEISICWWKLWQLTVIACLILATRAPASAAAAAWPVCSFIQRRQQSSLTMLHVLWILSFGLTVMAILRPLLLLLLLLCFVLPSSKSIKCFTCIGPVRSQFDKLLLFMSRIFSPVHLPQAPHLPEHPGWEREGLPSWRKILRT